MIEPYRQNMKLSEKLRLGLPKNDPFRNAINVAAAMLICAILGYNMHAAEAPPPVAPKAAVTPAAGVDKPATPPAAAPDPKAAEIAELQKQINSLSVSNRVIYEQRNELASQLLDAQAENKMLRQQNDALQKQAAPPAPVPTPPADPAKK